jgi:hypothetical protein
MSAPGYGTQALFLVTIALGAWIVHDAIAGPPTALGQSDTRAAREQSAVREPLNVLLPATSPAPVEMALVPSPRPAAAPSVQYVLLRPAGPTQSPTTTHGWHAPPTRARPGPGGEGHAPGAWDGGNYQVIATDGSIVYIGPNGHLIANTGPASSSGVIALAVKDSTLQSGNSTSVQEAVSPPPVAPSGETVAPPTPAPSTAVSLSGTLHPVDSPPSGELSTATASPCILGILHRQRGALQTLHELPQDCTPTESVASTPPSIRSVPADNDTERLRAGTGSQVTGPCCGIANPAR